IVWVSDFILWKNTTACAPTSARAHVNLGNVFFSQNIFDEALREYQEAINYSSPESPIDSVKLPYNMGLALRMTGKPEKAIEWFEGSVRAKPDFLPARYNLSAALVEAGNFGEGIAAAKETAAYAENEFRAQYIAGNISLRYGRERSDLLEAVYYFKRAIKLAPDFAGAYGNLGITYIRLGDSSAALKMLARAAELDSENPLPWLQMAEIYDGMEKDSDAERCRAEAKSRGVAGLDRTDLK
ncbi:MAG: tetratricopeptide repeat protein, partial [bacterium]